MKRSNTLSILFSIAALLLLGSCMGIDTEVKVSSGGSGTVVANYRLSEELISFGELEGNKDMLPVPLSEADLKKGLSGAQGLSFVSWSRKKDGNDTLVKTVIAFDNLDALVRYLDPQGTLASHETTAGGERISFTLGENMPSIDPQMRQIAQEAFSPYTFSFVFRLPKAPTQVLSVHPAVKVTRDGSVVRFEGGMKDIIADATAPAVTLEW